MESSTLFIADVPHNLQEPDFQALFRSSDGFVAARLRQDRNENVVGFVDFVDHASAARAKDRFQGYKFVPSPNDHHGISIHFSRTTTGGSGGGGGGGGAANRYKRNRDPEEDVPAYYSPLPVANYAAYQPSYFLQQPFQQQQQLQQGPQQPGLYPGLPPDASSTLYVEGLPLDATEREVAHIFRPFPGYQSLRVVSKESKQNPGRTYNLCFVEFDNKLHSTIAIYALQGYRIDAHDTKGLNITYAKTERKDGRIYSGQQPQRHHQTTTSNNNTSNASNNNPPSNAKHNNNVAPATSNLNRGNSTTDHE